LARRALHLSRCHACSRKRCPRIHARGERKRRLVGSVLRTGFAACAAAAISPRPHGDLGRRSWSGSPRRWRSSLHGASLVSWQRANTKPKTRREGDSSNRWHPRVALRCRTRWNRISPLPSGAISISIEGRRLGRQAPCPFTRSRGRPPRSRGKGDPIQTSPPILMGIGRSVAGTLTSHGIVSGGALVE